ncbi:hypothetical protein [Herbiconiux ginsengi]|uniref:hypothetical protein n=1 Tax=Herbiconiux ginsengi TaxID=381665 RepID=UPI0011149C2C|nr:hypothetical protein [Herbiconiux ginsengi]
MGSLLVLTGVTDPGTPALAADSSVVTVSANQQDLDLESAPMPDLSVTVSQTRDLLAQGIEVSWTGGVKSEVPSGQTGGKNFLQIMQCWGDDPENPGQPDRTTCQYGGFNTPGATRDSTISDDKNVAEQDVKYTAYGSDFINPTYTSIPFKSKTGVTIASVVDGKKVDVDVNTNPFFTRLTSNEVSWAGSGSNGEGSVKFEVQTATQASGLGCGAPVTGAGNVITGASCWLVIIPRGTADVGENDVLKSGLLWDNWKHRLAVKLDFLPDGARCTIGAKERQLSGSELASVAIASWQPTLCGAKGGAVYSTITGAESDAALAANGTTAAPLALTSRALSTPDVTDKLTYAPIALTGISVAFAIDREPNALGEVPDDAKARARLPFSSMNLTPRLVAKLLTSSYLDSLPTGASKEHLGYKGPADAGHNPRNITYDPDFLAINDEEWAYQSINAPSLSDLIAPQGRSDAAWALWSYVMSDQDAVDFLSGVPDPWKMTVNPWSSLNPDVYNAVSGGVGAPLTFPRDDFPKADPTEQPVAADGAASVNSVTWRPYTNDLSTSAYLVLRGDGQVLGAWDPVAAPPKYTKTSRSLTGLQRVIGLTDTGAAAKYQVFEAKLRNPAGKFVAPDDTSLAAAAAAMTVDPTQSQVYRFDPGSDQAKAAENAYPLAVPVYAAVNKEMSDAALRADYANFIIYAATAGQEPGTGFGQLPAGYAPIPQGWSDQAVSAAAVIASGKSTTPPTTPAKPAATTPRTVTAPPVPAAPAPPVSAPVSDPSASGGAAAALVGKPTPADQKLGAISGAVPLAILAGLLAAVAVPFITRIRRRL